MAHLIAGPACGMYLADMGADVIKVENPGSGDASRTAYARHLNGESAVFVTVNRNKRSVGLDLAHPDGRRVFHRLVEGADVVIEAYRGGVAERLGIDYDSHAARLSIFLATGEEPGRHGSAHPYLSPFQAFAARDGWIYVAAWLDRLWAPFCAAIERPDLAKDERFTTNESRVRHRAALNAILTPIFTHATVKEWMARLEAREVLCAPVNRYADLTTDPQVAATGMLVPDTHPRAGGFTSLGTPVRFGRTPGTIRTPAPQLGEHTELVLCEAGIAADEIARLRTAKVVA